MVVVFLFYRLLNRIHSIQQLYQAIAQGESAFWSIRQSIAEADASRETSAGSRKSVSFEHELRVESLQFSYGSKNVLRNVSLAIPAGQFAAIIGPSGAGKTTIIDLLIGLIEPAAGTIRIDGVLLREIDLRYWRSQIGYVPQEMFLFHDTILRNISLGDDTVTRQDAENALRSAEAWDFVSELPLGLDAVVGERGTKLSGGQRQRIAIARALVRRPKLLVLDEVTTSLDPESEAALCETLRNLAGKVTIVAVSHQPALIDVATTVYRLESGVITVSTTRTEFTAATAQ
jgi:ATP-binding cassette, subfamily C, bacterial